MTGVAFTSTQASGVVTTFVTILDIRWQPRLSADIKIGHFIDQDAYNNGFTPVCSLYVSLDIAQIVPTGNIPAQIINQLISAGGVLAGGTPI